MKNKIAYVHTGEWPSNSPSSTFATYNCVGISRQAQECHFFIKRNSKQKAESIFETFFHIKKPDNLIVYQIEKPLINSNQIYYLNIFAILKKLIKQGKIDAIITRNVTFLPTLIRLKNKFNVPVYFETHDFFADLTLRNDVNRKKKRKQSLIERKYIPKLTGLICLQESQKQIYQKVFPSTEMRVFRTGIPQFYRSNKERKYIAYIGSLDEHKGVHDLLEALSYCKTKPKLLIIGGKNPEEINRIEKMIEDYHIDGKISGWIDKKQLASYLQETAIGIVPLTNTFFNRYLTSPLKIFDYFSYGIPVISSELPTTRELIQENQSGVFFEAGNTQQLAEKIDSLISETAKLAEMRNYIYENCNNLLWENRAKLMLDWFGQHTS